MTRIRLAALALIAAIVALDAATKAWARNLPATTGRSWIRVVHNPGAAFGFGAYAPTLMSAVAVAVAAGIVVVLLRAGRPAVALSLAAVIGGGLANVLDRVSHGDVTDWIHLPWYPPSFNLADVAVRAGVILALLTMLPARRRGQAPSPRDPLTTWRRA